MYNIEIFEDANILLDWYTIYYGIKNNYLKNEIANQFVIRKLEEGKEVSQEELELSWRLDNKYEILTKIEKLPNINMNEKMSLEIVRNKICVAILIYLRKNENVFENLMQKIEMIYADFDYPSDMENFISYMPITDNYIPVEHTKEENENRLLANLDSFINEKLKEIKKS
ncbi:DUF2247 family protein [Clostridium sp. Marseille-P2415]|uniref:DUF2247 family protein n=1 Tax=Clostridium sp. Marseille-P2415 TaxID=1805471 RepID=UPI00098849B7|nr:DUF2247 family protein [Clostridium sp. Marseille-P2415]